MYKEKLVLPVLVSYVMPLSSSPVKSLVHFEKKIMTNVYKSIFLSKWTLWTILEFPIKIIIELCLSAFVMSTKNEKQCQG